MATLIQSICTLDNLNKTLTTIVSSDADDENTSMSDIATVISKVASLVVYSIKDENSSISQHNIITSSAFNKKEVKSEEPKRDDPKVLSPQCSSFNNVNDFFRAIEIEETRETPTDVESLQIELKATKALLLKALHHIEVLNSRLKLSNHISLSSKVQLEETTSEAVPLNSFQDFKKISTPSSSFPLNFSSPSLWMQADTSSIINHQSLETIDRICFENSLRDFYRKHNAQKMAEVPRLLRKYQGRRAEMIANLERKYCAPFVLAPPRLAGDNESLRCPCTPEQQHTKSLRSCVTLGETARERLAGRLSPVETNLRYLGGWS